MPKLFHKIRKDLIVGSRFSKYLLYAVGEIVLLVAGILIAVEINNWNSGKIERKNESKSYENIKRQLIDDHNELAKVKELNHYYSAQYEHANQIILSGDNSKIDTLATYSMIFSQYSDFHRSGNIYETLVNSGEIRLLKNSEIISQLQRLEMTYTNVNKLEEIHWEIIINELSPELRGVINYATLEIVKPKKLFSVEIQNFIVESIYLTKGKDAIYTKALNEIETIIQLINEEHTE